MKPIKSVVAGLAAAGLLLSQPAAAAAARTASPSRDGEQLAGVPSAALPAIIAILAVAIVGIIAASTDHNNDNVPVSP